MTTPRDPDDGRDPWAAPGDDEQAGEGRPGRMPSFAAGGRGAPTAPGYDQPSVAPRNGVGTAALVVGIVALVSVLISLPLALLAGIVGLILGIIGWRRVRRREATNRGVALAGTLLSAVAVVTAGVVIVVTVSRLAECYDEGRYPTTEQRDQCIDEKIGSR